MAGQNLFSILHDAARPLCFVGHSSLSQEIVSDIKHDRLCVQHSLEELETKSREWFDQYQFIVLASDVAFKQQAVNFLQQQQAHFFSIIGKHNIVNPDTVIGHGTYIYNFNDFLFRSNCIGDHCIVVAYCHFSHGVVIGDYSHISSYTYLSNCEIGAGSILGIRTSIIGFNGKISVANNTNLMLGSVVTKDLPETGTYFGNRRINDKSSLQQRIL
jgi:NDP-sugar pyrophosphorylase family protein